MTGGGLRIRAWSATSVGMVREGNEDSYFHGSTTFAVADGMGGHVAGEVASATALEPIAELDGAQFPSPSEATAALKGAITAANTTVFEKAAGNPELRGMGTTLTALLVRGGCFHLAHVGDSRAYRLRPGEDISRLTTDHTLVQQLIDEHRLEPEHADTHPQRSVITRAIGVERHVDPETLAPEELLPGDQILLCSDGLTGPVKDDEITRILSRHDDGQAACQALIDAANDAGGPDNITVVLLRVDLDPPAGRSGSNGCAADTAEFGSPVLRAGSSGSGSVTQIRTRDDHDADFNATKMGHYGELQGASRAPADPRRRKRRLLIRLSGAVALVVVVAACGYLIWSRTYFVGDHSGHVTIFRGVRHEVGGLALSQMVQETDVRTADLPPPLRNQILQDGVPFPNPGEAWQYVNGLLRMQARETQAERKAVEIPRPFPSPDAGAPALPQPRPILTPTAGPKP
ncbi:MAG: Stp1/IreP family PP2C-type Ser/Thr phosphatase [Egibacteraceae bacterium]